MVSMFPCSASIRFGKELSRPEPGSSSAQLSSGATVSTNSESPKAEVTVPSKPEVSNGFFKEPHRVIGRLYKKVNVGAIASYLGLAGAAGLCYVVLTLLRKVIGKCVGKLVN